MGGPVRRLDPIVIVPHDPAWAERVAVIRTHVADALAPVLVRPVEHIGSTAVPGLAAKPIVDVLAVVRDIDDADDLLPRLLGHGWVAAPEPADEARRRRSMCAPSVERRTEHLHVVEAGSDGWRGWLAFRDHLRAHPDLAAEYERLKRRLALDHGADPDDRAAYRAGKSDFIRRITAAARSGDDPAG